MLLYLTLFSMLHSPNFVLKIHKYNFILFYFWPHCTACGILVPWPGIEPMPSVVKVLSPYHWTTREFPILFLKNSISFLLLFHLNLWSREGKAEQDHSLMPPAFLPHPCCLSSSISNTSQSPTLTSREVTSWHPQAPAEVALLLLLSPEEALLFPPRL